MDPDSLAERYNAICCFVTVTLPSLQGKAVILCERWVVLMAANCRTLDKIVDAGGVCGGYLEYIFVFYQFVMSFYVGCCVTIIPSGGLSTLVILSENTGKTREKTA